MGCASSASPRRQDAHTPLSSCADQPDGVHAKAMLECSSQLASLEDVQKALQRSGVISMRTVFALDLTKANKSAGTTSFHGAQQAKLRA